MREHDLRAMLEDVRAGRLARRSFIERMAGLGIGVALSSAMLAAAGVARAQPLAPYKPTKRGGGGALKLLFWQGPTLLNPHFATGAKDLDGARLFYESLVRYDADANPVPVLAAEIPSRDNGGIAADGRSTTWKLKKGVKWHDGRPFTADDVIFNWTYATDPATAAFTLGSYEGVKAVTKIDAETVRFEFNKPTPIWARAATVQLIPKHLFEAFAGAKSRDAPANLKPVGTGPYRFVEFRPGDLVRGEINTDYHAPNRPHFDSVELKGGGDADLRRARRAADRRVRLRLEPAGRRRGAEADGGGGQGPRRRLRQRQRRDRPAQHGRSGERGRGRAAQPQVAPSDPERQGGARGAGAAVRPQERAGIRLRPRRRRRRPTS